MRERSPSCVVEPKILYFGTPVVLLSTLNPDATTNLTPMSSAWALGERLVLGLAEGGQGLKNLRGHGECVLNLPDADMWAAVEALAPLTAADPMPDWKRELFRTDRDKFRAAGLTRAESECVRPLRVSECPLQIEARVVHIRDAQGSVGFAVIEVEALRVHAHGRIALDRTHIDPTAWNPLIYSFRHYFGLGQRLGKTFRAEV